MVMETIAVATHRQLGAAHRKQRTSLEALLDPANDPTSDLAVPLALWVRHVDRTRRETSFAISSCSVRTSAIFLL
jgi:hypothetical protein